MIHPPETAAVPPATPPRKTLTERFLHAFFFEVIAIVMSAPVAAWAMDKPVFDMGVLTGVIALIALFWNMVYNAGFERVERRFGLARTLPVRVVHACGFEVGLVLIVVPLAAGWLSIGWWAAFMLDLGFLMFYLPYAFFYNLAYDRLRARWWGRAPALQRA